MKRFVEGIDRGQATLFPECLEDWIDGDHPVRVIDAFVEKLDLSRLGFDGVAPEATGRPSSLWRLPALSVQTCLHARIKSLDNPRLPASAVQLRIIF